MIFNFYSHLTDGEQGGGGGRGRERSASPAGRAAECSGATERRASAEVAVEGPEIASLDRFPPRFQREWLPCRSRPRPSLSTSVLHRVMPTGPPPLPHPASAEAEHQGRAGRGVSRWGLARGPVQASRMQRSERRYSVFSGGWAGRAAGGGPAAAGAARRGPGRPRWEDSLPGAG